MGALLDNIFMVIVVFAVLFVIISIFYGFGHIFYGLYCYWRLKRKAKWLQNNLNNIGVGEFIELVGRSVLTYYPGLWRVLRQTYDMVAKEPGVDGYLKEQLRELLVAEGVSDM